MTSKLKDITIAQKLMLATALFVLTALLAYSFAIKETLEIQSQLNSFSKANAEQVNYPQQIQTYKAAINRLDSIFDRDSVHISIRNKILRFAESYSDTTDIEIIRFQESSQSRQEEYSLVYNTLCMKGSYEDLLRFYHCFENKESSDKLISLNFYLKKEKYKKNKALYSEGLIQSILYDEQ